MSAGEVGNGHSTSLPRPVFSPAGAYRCEINRFQRSSPIVVSSWPTTVACRSHSAFSFVHSTMTGC